MKFKDIKRLVKELGSLAFTASPWGMAVTFKAFDDYKNSELFDERAKVFGPLTAIEMFTEREYWLRRHLIIKNNKKFLLSIIYPFSYIKKMAEKDVFYRQRVVEAWTRKDKA